MKIYASNQINCSQSYNQNHIYSLKPIDCKLRINVQISVNNKAERKQHIPKKEIMGKLRLKLK